MLNVVLCYKHLGSYLATGAGVGNGNVNNRRNIGHRVSSALAAYNPLSSKVFGSDHLSIDYKICFFRSLIMSRLTYNLHIFVLSHRDLKRLNSVYMRGMRRICGDSRFSKEVQFNDLQVRQKLHVASLDCLLMGARLRYLGRLVRHHPQTLCALLHVHKDHMVLPWVALVSRDCDGLVARGLVPASLGAFAASPLGILWADRHLDLG